MGAATSIYDRIQRHKRAVVEPRDGALFPAAAESFRAGLADRTYTGAVFFAVCRCALPFAHVSPQA